MNELSQKIPITGVLRGITGAYYILIIVIWLTTPKYKNSTIHKLLAYGSTTQSSMLGTGYLLWQVDTILANSF